MQGLNGAEFQGRVGTRWGWKGPGNVIALLVMSVRFFHHFLLSITTSVTLIPLELERSHSTAQLPEGPVPSSSPAAHCLGGPPLG